MLPVIFVSVRWIFPSFFLLVSASNVIASVPRNITAKVGEDVTLQCQAPKDNTVLLIEWTRPDLEPQYVFLERDGRPDLAYQHPSFKNRVNLKDEQMNNGDVSVILKGVRLEDTGKYECHAIHKKTTRKRRATFETKPIYTIQLTVTDSGDEAGDTRKEEHNIEENKDSGGMVDDGKTDENSRGHIVTVMLFMGMIAFIVLTILLTKIHKKKLHLSPSDEECDKHPA